MSLKGRGYAWESSLVLEGTNRKRNCFEKANWLLSSATRGKEMRKGNQLIRRETLGRSPRAGDNRGGEREKGASGATPSKITWGKMKGC